MLWTKTVSSRLWKVGRPLPPVRSARPGIEDWKAANPRWIEKALRHALNLPAGGWYVVDASRSITEQPRCVRIRDQGLVAWRAEGKAYVAPNSCPHMAAPLDVGKVRDGRLVCPWHGLTLGPEGHGRWRPWPTHDDGVLVWVRLEDGEEPTDRPILAERPMRFVDAVMRMEASCEPEDVLANRLDPWHGVHFHPHSFARLEVIDQKEEEITVRVAYRIAGPLVMEVDANFHCPDRRTIVMTIVDGDGKGSVVETHATPIASGRTAIVEATLASSDRPGFGYAVAAARLIRPLVERAARRLWVEDAAYAERIRSLRRSRERRAPAGDEGRVS